MHTHSQDNLFEWHFTVRGPSDSPFENGLYHGRIILPTDYPMKPPSIILLTPSGRFEVNKKICLSISGHHPESWQPSWSIRTALLAIIGFMPTQGRGALGSLDYEPEERRQLAIKSQSWSCPTCGPIRGLLRQPSAHCVTDEERAEDEQQKRLAKQICFKNNSPSNSETQQSDSPEPEEQEIRQRSSAVTTASTDASVMQTIESQETIAGHNLNRTSADSESASSQFITYLMIIIFAALLFLMLRRLFLMWFTNDEEKKLCDLSLNEILADNCSNWRRMRRQEILTIMIFLTPSDRWFNDSNICYLNPITFSLWGKRGKGVEVSGSCYSCPLVFACVSWTNFNCFSFHQIPSWLIVAQINWFSMWLLSQSICSRVAVSPFPLVSLLSFCLWPAS